MRVSLGLLLLPIVSCSDEAALNRASTTDKFEQAASNEVDILWVVDNSISMANEQENVAAGAADFVENIKTSRMDLHLGVISTDVSLENLSAGVLLGNPPYLTNACELDDIQGNESECDGYADDFGSRVRMGTGGSDQEAGLEAAWMALSPPLADTRNAGFLRKDAMLNIVILSDENDCSDFGALGDGSTGENCYTQYEKLRPVVDIVRDIIHLKEGGGEIIMSGIIGPEVVAATCEDTVPGRRYEGAISLFGGVRADICQTDYSAIMDQLGLAASGIKSTFQLSHNADVDTIEVTVTPPDGAAEVVPQDDASGWSYIVDYAQVQFNGDSVPVRGASIEISYVIASGAVQVEEGGDTDAQ